MLRGQPEGMGVGAVDRVEEVAAHPLGP
jgi:hypothetical protein